MTTLTKVTEEVRNAFAKRCAELNYELIVVGTNEENYVVMAKRKSDGNFATWTQCTSNGKDASLYSGCYTTTEETAMEVFYTGNSHYRTEIVDRKVPCSYDRLVEIATRYKDVAFESDYDAAMETTREEIDLQPDEAEFLGVDLAETEGEECFDEE